MARSTCDEVCDQPSNDPACVARQKRPRLETRQRQQFRLADLLCTALRQTGQERPLPMFPDSAWQMVANWRRNLEFVQSRQWHGAIVECRQELDAVLHELVDQANTARQRLREMDEDRPDVRLRDVYDELVALDAEFGDVEWDVREQKLSVITESIELEDMDLGPFKIELDWSDLRVARTYRVIALEPNAAAGDEDVTHPHVHDRTLCEGDGRVPIRNALRQGRLCDFFLLVQQVLQTYNASSAYVRLTDWDGKSCADCGDSCGRNNSNYCDSCEITLCSDCGGMCSDCEGNFCAECRGVCHGCDNRFCRNCLSDCVGCKRGFCQECLNDGSCDQCRESDDEAADAGATSSATTTATPDAAVHSVGVGEVGVSA